MELACSVTPDKYTLISGIITGIVGSLSCIGNLTCAIVLTNKLSLKTSTNFILLAMSTSDLVYSVLCMQFTAYSVFMHSCTGKSYTDWYYPLIFPYVFTLTNIGKCNYLSICKRRLIIINYS